MNQFSTREQLLNRIQTVKLTFTSEVPYEARPKVTCSDDVIKLCTLIHDPETIEHVETMYAVLLDAKHRVIGVQMLGTGSHNTASVDLKVSLQGVILAHASSVILLHNHPSGSLDPSKQDMTLTRSFEKACEMFKVKVLDHVIVAKGGYYSFADNGLLTS